MGGHNTRRSGELESAQDAYAQLATGTGASGTEWALGLDARCRALIVEGEGAELSYREAIARLAVTRQRVDLARAHLLYGEWLRRARRRIEAREQLRLAERMFETMGVDGFAERAHRESRTTAKRRRSAERATAATTFLIWQRSVAIAYREDQ